MSSRIIVARARLSVAPFFLFLLCLLAAFARTATANPVTIGDASFDSRSLAVAGLTTTLTPWLETGGTSNGNGWFERVNGFAADGQNHLVMNLNHNVWQDLGVTYQDSTRYTLTVAVGNRDSTSTLATNQSRYLLAASDGTVFATGTLNASTVPVGTFIDAPALVFETGESSPASGKTIRILLQAGGGGRSHFDRVRLTALPTNPPIVTTDAASSLTQTGATLNGTVNPLGQTASVSFSYGPTSAYGSTVTATPATISGSTALAVSADLTGLPADSTWHYRVVAETAGGQVVGEDQTFTTTSLATLKDLSLGSIPLSPAFAPATIRYSASVPSATSAIAVTPTTLHAGASATVNGVPVASGTASGPIALAEGPNLVSVAVLAADGVNRLTYTIEVTRGTVVAATFNSATTVPVTAANYQPTGTVNLALNFAPPTGTNLTVVNNTGTDLIQGTFDNLAQGQKVDLAFNGILYPFVANYYGGTGNDLVLQWANTRLLAWGSNSNGELGNGGMRGSVPTAVNTSGVLDGKILLGVTGGGSHSFAFFSDGTVAGWGTYQQLGLQLSTTTPLAVGSGELANRTVVAMDAGTSHTLALCADGALVAWGRGIYGQLGSGSSPFDSLPVLVTRSGVLAGKTITQIAAGGDHSLALCSDGTLTAWGDEARLGNNLTTSSSVPVLVSRTGVLAGKSVVAIAAGGLHSLALCSDGTLVAWGGNGSGQLGNNSRTNALVPVLVNRTGVLAGKTITAIAAGFDHSMALCSDGTVAVWGENGSGQLGDGIGTTDKLVPALVNQAGVLSGKTVVAVDAGSNFSVARCSDGTLAAWGFGANGELGNGGKASSNAAVTVSASALSTGERFTGVLCGVRHSLALVASPPPPAVETLAASGIGDTGAILHANANSNGPGATVSFEYGLTTLYGTSISGTPANITGTTTTPVTAVLTGLPPNRLYHYRVVANGPGGTVRGADLTFTTTDVAALKSLVLGDATLLPAFRRELTTYSATVSADTTRITVTPTSRSNTETVTVNGVAVPSGTASGAINLIPGNNPIQVVVAEAGQTRTYTVTVTRLPEVYAFDTSASVPVTVGGMVATGKRVEFALNHAPAAGANLTVVSNTGMDFIQGSFDNLAHGQLVQLSYAGVTYPFVANYFGGSGNDLVLQWANVRPFAWGIGGALGNGGLAGSWVPVAATMSEALAGKTILGFDAGGGHSLTLTADGSMASWGLNNYGQLGNGTFTNAEVPVAVTRTGVLAGKTVIAVAAGDDHSLALCRDGTLAAWGKNDYGQLGGSGSSSALPVLVNRTGALEGKTVVAIAAGSNNSLALCSDGTLAAWGSGPLGNGTTNPSSVPVMVDQTGVLAGRTITGIGAGFYHFLVLCADGSVAAWGYNSEGQLGNGTTTQSLVPTFVNQMGVLAGKTVSAITVGKYHNLALCADGTLAAWGKDTDGQPLSVLPAVVTQTGVLAGKTIVSIAAGNGYNSFSLVTCADGTAAAWGDNTYGQLGNDSRTASALPVAVNTNGLGVGERFTNGNCGEWFALALVAAPPPAAASTLAATAILDTTATLNGSASPNGSATSLVFEYGPTTAYGTTVAATPANLAGVSETAVSLDLTGLLSGTTYHYRMVATSAGGTVRGANMTFTTSSLAALASLGVDQGSMWPAFASATNRYEIVVPYSTENVRFTPTATDPSATVRVNGAVVAAGSASGPIPLSVGSRTVSITVDAANGVNTQTYVLTVIRRPEVISFNNATDIPLTIGGFNASGSSVQFKLNFAPPAGTDLIVVNNLGLAPIEGTFANLAQGQKVNLAYNGAVYAFIANYHGGSGNDLVLQWANTRLAAWGANGSGQLGINTTTDSTLPVAVDATGVLSGKPIIAISHSGPGQSLVLCADGTLAAWGANSVGQLGNNSTTDSKVPEAVDRSGVLANKLAVAAATGRTHQLVLCADGTLVTWGGNSAGQLGVGDTSNRSVPVAVNTTGVLAGKRVAAIAAGGDFCMVLCADGTLATWGENTDGQLGIGTTKNSNVPVLVDRSGVLLGKNIVAISAGDNHAMALCSDGSIAAWGNGRSGQMGTGIYVNRNVPVLVNRAGALAGKTVVGIASGEGFNMALCSDGTRVAWGDNSYSQLGNSSVSGNGSTSSSLLPVPVLITNTGVLAGKLINRVIPAARHNLVFCSDGTLAAWGNDGNGRLGDGPGYVYSSYTPVLVNTTLLKTGERFSAAASGPLSSHNLALIATPPAPDASTLAATAINDVGATLNGSVSPNKNTTAVFFEYGPTPSYGTKVAATPASASGTAATTASLTVTGLKPGTLYHYRILVTSENGTAAGDDLMFTTTESATLAGLSLSAGTLAPDFAKTRFGYDAMVPFNASSITVTPVATFSEATIRVNGTVVATGAASGPINLSPGLNTITTAVTSADGVNTLSYTVKVTRLPGTYTFNSATTVPVTANGVVLGGENAAISLNFTPVAGTRLTLINNTGNSAIQGTFGNLAQGQIINLPFGGAPYSFVVNYYGGTGNDMVLQWASNRLLAWGDNASGQLGNNSTALSNVPTPVDLNGALAGKTILTAVAGGTRNLVLCADGSLFQWGEDTTGNLSSWNGAISMVAVPVDQTGVLAGKRVTSIAVGDNHCLVLCSDGTLAAWGNNTSAQLGNATAVIGSSTPVLVDQTGVLAGKTVVAISAGAYHNLVLCADGTVAIWGGNGNGQLGDGTTNSRSQPLLVNRTGVLADKTITAIAAGGFHSLVQCSDGTLAGWGYNSSGQLGNGSSSNISLPVSVNQTGVLAGKTITAIAAGYRHSSALCSDGTLATWGSNSYGGLGNGSNTNATAPVLVTRTGVLAGKTISTFAGGEYHSAVLCTDGKIASWGYNTSGELGNGTTANSNVPVLVNTAMQLNGERFATLTSGSHHSLALSAMPPPPVATTLAATAITDTSVALNGQVNAQGSPTTVTFEYGLTESYGQTATATPASASGTNTTAVALNLSGLISGATYYYRVVATSAGGVSRGADMTFTTTTLSRLASLGVSAGTLTPTFAPSTVSYLATVPFAAASITLNPQVEIATTTIRVNGTAVASGTASNPLPLAVGNNAVTVVTTAAGGMGTMTYTVMVTRMPQAFAFSSATSVPLSTGDFVATGMSAAFALSYAPVPGTDLTVINNTGANAIQGRFTNLTHGQAVAIAFGGITYVFVADYFGGTGNDLILRWANTRPFAWGYNANGRVGNNTTADAWMPVPVDRSGYLADKVVTTVAAGSNHSLALCHDGTVAAWGSANNYQLGNGSTSNSQIPKLVSLTGALAGKTVTAITAGANHSLALCSDGTVLAWGSNSSGQIGNNSTYGPMNPVAVNRSGVLKDKRVIAMAAGDSHSMVLCDDGTLAAWGAGSNGQLGTGSTTSSTVPVLVRQTGVLAGKRVTAISAGAFHSLALCSDGTLAAWGYNSYGQLGNNSTTNSLVPVPVSLTGQFAGKAATAISAGDYHSLFLFADGSVAACGYNDYGQLGNNTTTNSSVPVAVIRTGVLSGKTVAAVVAASRRSFALCTDGTVAAWGHNNSGYLGNNNTTNSSVPVLVNTANLTTGERFTKLSGSLALAAATPTDLIPSIADGSSVIGTSQTLAWSREPLATTYRVFFGTNRDAVAAAIETSPEYLGESATPAWTGTQPVLAANAVYYWRVDTHYTSGMRLGKVWSFRIAPIEMAASVSHTMIRGMAAATLDIPINSALAAPQPWTVSGASLPAWLTLVTATGTTPQPLQLRFTPGSLAAGSYQTVLRVVSGAAAFDLPVSFRIVEIGITKLVAHPTRPVVYGLNAAASGETFARLVEIDAATGALLRTMPIGSGPTDLDLDPVSERLYVPTMTNWTHTGTRVIDLSTWTELQSLKLVEKAYKLEATPTGRLISEGSDQWVTADLYDASNGNKLATLGSVRAGDCEVDPTGKYYYHCDANSSGARIRKYDISRDSFESVLDGPILAYGSFNLILSGDGSRLFWQGFSFAANDLQTIAKLPGEVHATNRGGDLAVGPSALWWADTGTQAAALPFTSTVAAISASDSYLVRFDSTSKAIVSTPLASLTDLPGPWPRPGQELTTSPQRLSWSPVPGATAYRLFIGADAGALQGMTAPTATVTEPFYDLPVPLAAGGFYAWRVDVLNTSGTTAGSVRTFGIRFAEGPPVPIIASSSYAATGYAVSLSDRRMLVGIGDIAQVLDFDPATGATALGQPLTALNGGEDVLSLDGEKSVFGSYSYDSTLDNIGAAFVYRQVPAGYWEQSSPLTLPTPVASEQFGTSVAASGNLLLAGAGESNGRIGRVGAFVTEPTATRVQTFTAADAANGDSFGYRIAMEGNQAIIAAPGRGSFYNRVGCLYAFTRSTTTGQWAQTQKIAIPGATTSGGSGKALALSGNLLATYSDSGAVVIFTRNPSGQWLQTSSIPRATVAGSSTTFGADLVLAGDLLFIGDTGGTYQGYGGGAVFVFRRDGANWLAMPTITPASASPIATYTNFGGALAVRDGWLAVGGGTSRQVWMIRIDSFANRTPQFLPGIPSQGVVGRALNAAIRADDADGSDSLTIDLLQGPAWLKLTDSGNGNATLTGNPIGNSGEVSEIQLRVRDGDGAEVLYAQRFTLLEPSDLPVFTVEPTDSVTSVGRELILTANASGVGPFQWQWYREGEPLKDATQATLAFDEITMSDAGRYQVRVTNTAGEAVSTEVTVTVNPATRLGGDWPTFGGSPAHGGRHAAALDATWFIPSWSQAITTDGRMINRAAIVGNRAFVVPQASRNAASDVKALDLTTGATFWSTSVVASYSYTPPTVFNGRVYFQRVNNSNGNQLFSLNAETGAQIWASNFGAQWDSYEAPAVSDLGIFMNGGTYGGMYGYNFDGSQRFFLTLSQNNGWTPTIHRNRLFSFVGGSFIEHDPANGVTLWGLPNMGGTAVIAAQGNSAVVVIGNTLNCFDLRSRSLRWKSSAAFSGRPAIGDGRVFAIQGDKVVSHALADGAPSIIYQAQTGLIGQPIVFNDRLVVSSETKTWIFNLDDGAMLQTLNVGGRLSYSNGYLLAAGNDGVLRAFTALNFNPKLASLGLGPGGYLPEFDSLTTRYIATVPFDTETVTITPTTEYPDATVKINGVPSPNGSASRQLALNVGENEIQTLVTAEDGITTMTYTVVVTRLPQNFVFSSATDIPLTANGFLTGDFPVNILLNYPPVPGTTLTMVDNTGLGFIYGRFSNLAHGQRVWLTYEGVSYAFVANYYGGTGNDLVLQWAGTRVAAWGLNNYGQLGDGGTTQRLSPVAADHSGVLADKTIFAIATGYLHSVALCSDGTLASWGYNVQGQLGDNGSAHQSVPVAVDSSGVLADKVVIALASGSYHNLALCSDGSVAAWGYNNYGQLGDGTKVTARMPVLVNTGGILAGKQVVAVAAGAYQSYALCSDGTLAAWGYNDEGELGNGGKTGSLVPVAVDVSGALAGRKVARIAAGQYHTLALCTDGTLVSWGYNPRGQLGNSSTADSKSPVEIGSFGALAGKSVKAVSAGASHSLALCDDGTLAAWGFNSQSQLGRTGITQSTTPVAVVPPARPLAAIAAGAHHNLLRFTDGGMAAWGGNSNGQLGSNNTQAGAAVTDVDTNALDHGGFIMFAASGCASSHNLAVFAVPVDLPAGLEAWRLENFGDMRADDPLAGDCADCDGDGIPNLVEYAFGFDPRAQCGGKLPVPQRTGDRFELRFSLAPAAPGIEYGAEWSPDLRPGSWRDVPDSGSGDEHLFSLPVDTSPTLFMRHRVRALVPQ
jgi:alpha-tubulin suppressor-like RCC1 family protein/phosphodiesterase/alkaline phosphatase D-like protein